MIHDSQDPWVRIKDGIESSTIRIFRHNPTYGTRIRIKVEAELEVDVDALSKVISNYCFIQLSSLWWLDREPRHSERCCDELVYLEQLAQTASTPSVDDETTLENGTEKGGGPQWKLSGKILGWSPIIIAFFAARFVATWIRNRTPLRISPL
ncbi:hypothetical protein BC829DRAFT_415376 [Chytridium lagenaria]|nr:hypothetical protein BC829DRAFT_415376 [Chytridium lagenaria]